MLVIWRLRKPELREINLPKATQLGSGEDSNQTQVCLTPTLLRAHIPKPCFLNSCGGITFLGKVSFAEYDLLSCK